MVSRELLNARNISRHGPKSRVPGGDTGDTEAGPAMALETAPAVTSSPSVQGSSLPVHPPMPGAGSAQGSAELCLPSRPLRGAQPRRGPAAPPARPRPPRPALTYVGAAGQRLPARRRVRSHGGRRSPPLSRAGSAAAKPKGTRGRGHAAGEAPGAGATPGPPRKRRAPPAAGRGPRAAVEGAGGSRMGGSPETSRYSRVI